MPASPKGFRGHLAAKPRGLASVHAWVFILLLAFALPASAADYTVHFEPSVSPDVEGYIVYVDVADGSGRREFRPPADIGLPPEPAPGEPFTHTLTGLSTTDTYYVVMRAYDVDGLESVDSNELEIECLSGNCDVVVPECTFDNDCNDGNTCTTDRCSAGTCSYTANVGQTCNDGNSGTIGDVCRANATCSGVPPACNSDSECDDGNDCTDDQCDPFAGCSSTPVANGTSCEDSDVCTVNEVCTAGTCGGGTVPVGDGYYEVVVDDDNHKIYDMSGGYDGVDVVGFTADYDLAVDMGGTVTGSGLVMHPNMSSPAQAMVYGYMKGYAGTFTFVLIYKMSDPQATGTLYQAFTIKPGAGTYSLTSWSKVLVAGQWLKKSDNRSSVPISSLPWVLPSGAWTLFLDVIQLDGTMLDADATVQLGTGTEIDYDGWGKISRGTGLLYLKSATSPSMPLNVSVDPGGITSTGIAYNVMKQSGTAKDWTEIVRDTCEE